MWAEQDSNLRRLMPADLQSAPVDRFGIDPVYLFTINKLSFIVNKIDISLKIWQDINSYLKTINLLTSQSQKLKTRQNNKEKES